MSRSGSVNAAYLLKVIVLLLVNCFAAVVVVVVVVDMGGVVTAVRMLSYVLVGLVVTAIISRRDSVGVVGVVGVIAGMDTMVLDTMVLFLPLLLSLGVRTEILIAFEIPP